MPKCSCGRIAPRCDYCREDKRKRNKAAYTTEARREKGRRERLRLKLGNIIRREDPMDIRQAEMILARKPPRSVVTWLELSAGRSNS